MPSPVNCCELCIYNAIPEMPLKKAIQRDTLKNTIDKQK